MRHSAGDRGTWSPLSRCTISLRERCIILRVRLPDETLAMPGYEVLRRLQHVAGMLKIVRGNAKEIETYFARLNDPADPVPLLRLWNPDDRSVFDAHLDEVERLVFNFLSACYSRVEFYRTLVDARLVERPLRVEYDDRIRAFSGSPLHRWIFALRRLMQHHALPVTRGELNFAHGGPLRTTLLIDLEHLRKYHADEFTGPARAYMGDRAEQDFLKASSEYVDSLSQFDGWFGPAYVATHLGEAETFLAARDAAIREYLGELLGDP